MMRITLSVQAMLVVLLVCAHAAAPPYVAEGRVTDCWQGRKIPVKDLEVRLYERTRENVPIYERLTTLERMRTQTAVDDAKFFSEYEKFEKALTASHPLELKKTDAQGTFRLIKAAKNKNYFIIFFAQLEDEPSYFRYVDLDTSRPPSKLAVAMNDEPCNARP